MKGRGEEEPGGGREGWMGPTRGLGQWRGTGLSPGSVLPHSLHPNQPHLLPPPEGSLWLGF